MRKCEHEGYVPWAKHLRPFYKRYVNKAVRRIARLTLKGDKEAIDIRTNDRRYT